MTPSRPTEQLKRKREANHKEADEHREEIVRQAIELEPGSAELAKRAVFEMTEGQDHGVEDDEGATIEEVADSPMSVRDAKTEIVDDDSEPEDAEAEPFPRAMGEGP